MKIPVNVNLGELYAQPPTPYNVMGILREEIEQAFVKHGEDLAERQRTHTRSYHPHAVERERLVLSTRRESEAVSNTITRLIVAVKDELFAKFIGDTPWQLFEYSLYQALQYVQQQGHVASFEIGRFDSYRITESNKRKLLELLSKTDTVIRIRVYSQYGTGNLLPAVARDTMRRGAGFVTFRPNFSPNTRHVIHFDVLDPI